VSQLDLSVNPRGELSFFLKRLLFVLTNSGNMQQKNDSPSLDTTSWQARNISSDCPLPFNSIWDTKGVIIAGSQSDCGSDSYSLCRPNDIFLDETNHKLYIADTENNRVQVYSLLTTEQLPVGVTVANHGLIRPSSIFVDIETEDMYILDYNKNETLDLADLVHFRVQLWHTDDLAGEVLIDEPGEYGFQPAASTITLDNQRNIYISTKYHIRKCPSSIRYKHCIIIAGLSERSGNTLYDLSYATSFYLDQHLTLFIVDTGNKRIMRWYVNSTVGEILVKTGPIESGIAVDCYGRIYWAVNQAIYRYDSTNNESKLIVGGNLHSLWMIKAIKFDKFGNLFVADPVSNRIRKFSILT
jgi:hypothetical protein